MKKSLFYLEEDGCFWQNLNRPGSKHLLLVRVAQGPHEGRPQGRHCLLSAFLVSSRPWQRMFTSVQSPLGKPCLNTEGFPPGRAIVPTHHWEANGHGKFRGSSGKYVFTAIYNSTLHKEIYLHQPTEIALTQ